MPVVDISPVRTFLGCETPNTWIDKALSDLPTLLIDHAHCEKKAASTALNLMYSYPQRQRLLHKLSRLAREELRHFEQVLAIMEERDIRYDHLSPSRYASALRSCVRNGEPHRLVDILIIGAFIEARSCERFAAIAPRLEAQDEQLAKYYRFLLNSESRHFEDYLSLAEEYADGPIDDRVALIREKEASLITSDDPQFRFHSGVPVTA